MKNTFRSLSLVFGFCTVILAQTEPPTQTPQGLLAAVIGKVSVMVEPPAGSVPRTWSMTVRVVAAEGLGQGIVGQQVEVAFQAPDRFRLAGQVERHPLVVARNGQQLWIVAPEKNFGILGLPGRPRFATAPERKDDTELGPVKLPLKPEQRLLLPLLMQLEPLPEQTIGGAHCRGLRVVPQPQAIEALRIPNGELKLWVREPDLLPVRLQVTSEKGQSLLLEFQDAKDEAPWPAERWQPPALPAGVVEPVALGHVARFLSAALSLLNQRVPALGPAKGERALLAAEGAGRLEDHDGTKVLFLKGTPEEMGRQHGVLMKRQVRNLVDNILYGVGVGSSFEKGRWFFGEIEEAQQRLTPFMDERYLREMDALAAAAGLQKEEVRLANFFPELFHCSGFALFGQSTLEGRLYHGRILDYLKGVGLEPNAVVIVHQPDAGYAWANISYAGFVGTVTAMNQRRISIGEMGGRGEGQWDGKPMAQLLREVMEKADNLDKAIDILRRGPRTCEYYYVVADGNSRRAVGVAATPTTFELVWPGQSHPRLPHAIPDAVLMSAGDRYETLAERVQNQHGKLDAEGARRLMERPVAMKSNIHSVLFAPETLDFWVANADSSNVASHTRYTHYNLSELLGGRLESLRSEVSK
jgi:isopenicillin-N N-acyltransferase-like protein